MNIMLCMHFTLWFIFNHQNMRLFHGQIFICLTLFLTNCEQACNLKLPKQSSYPIVLWHGMGDYYSNPLMNSIKRFIEIHIPHVHVMSLKIGTSILEDFKNGYFMDVNKQIDYVCQILSMDKSLKHGYNAIGISQGAQFFRGVAERCAKPPIINLISLGGQHQGVYGIPHCSSKNSKFCDYLRKLISYYIYNDWIQKHLVQAEFWHDPLNENMYKNKCQFLSDINNERVLNYAYKRHLLQLRNFVLIKFSNDSVVDPIDSEWFGFYKPGQSNETYTLQESALYKEDKLGLKQLHNNGRLHFLTMPGDHVEINWNWFLENIIKRFLL